MANKRVAIFFTGGTISMKFDPAIGAAVPALSGREIIENVPGLGEIAEIEIIDFGRFPGPHMTPPRMMELSLLLREAIARSDVDGAVVTHGTDTLEETAYFLDLTVATGKPVVVTGAMRNSSELGWDGPSNLLAATRVAASSQCCDLGVLVVFNETILAAADTTKTHTEAFDTFQSPDFGALGVVDKGTVILRRTPEPRLHLDTSAVVEPVYLIKMAAGADSTLIDACITGGAKGLLIEGLGRGNVPPDSVPGIERAIGEGIPVVVASRCLRGRVFESYGYYGGNKQLRRAGAISAGFLNGQKARIKLMLALSVTKDLSEIRNMFELDEYQRGSASK
jgi:L-asparaginase